MGHREKMWIQIHIESIQVEIIAESVLDCHDGFVKHGG
jgi:hypothetical protein